MKQVTLLVIVEENDDSYASTTTKISKFASQEDARKFIIDKLCEDFSLPSWRCNTLAHIANELSFDGIQSGVEGDCDGDTEFWWSDNGKGERFSIITLENNGNFVTI